MRRYFGTDGVRGVVGEDLTPELVEQLGKASTLWSGRGRVFVGRDTRGSGPELEEAFARGVVAAGGNAVLAGVLPTPAVALLALDLGVVISASHNPPEYNGVKFFDRNGSKLSDASEEEIEALLDAPALSRAGGGSIDRVDVYTESYLEHVLERFGNDLTGLRIGGRLGERRLRRDRAGGVRAARRRGDRDRRRAERENINEGCGATDLALLQRPSERRARPRGRVRRRRRPDARGRRRRERVDGDQILAVLALHLGVDLVAVTVMTNLGFHRLMDEHGVRVLTTPVGDRYVLEALRRENGILGGEQSGQ